MPTSKLAKHGWKILFLLICAFYLYGLGALPLIGPDEPRYAEVAREMFLRRDLITPTLGGLPWFEKPALLYWLMIANFRLIGVGEYAARLGPALCGLVTAGFTYWLGKSVETDARNQREHLGRWSALVLLSSFGTIAFSRAASFDIVLTMTITGALCCLFVGHISGAREGKRARVSIIGFYVFIGLSLLAKGLIGLVLPCGIIAGYFIIRCELPSRRFLLSLFWGIPVSLVVASIWYGPMLYRHGWTFIDQFIIQHHFARFLSNKYHHPQPFYFYLPVLLLMVLPWTIILIAAVASARRWRWRATDPLSRARVFTAVWVIVPLVFFSFSQSKIPGYILPVLPAVAFLIGERISCSVSAERGVRVIRLTGILLLIGGVVGTWYAVQKLSVPATVVAPAAALIGIVGALALTLPRYRKLLFLLFGILPFTIAAVALRPAATFAGRESVRDLIRTADAHGFADKPVFFLLADDRTAEFYAASRLVYEPNGEPARFEGAQDVAAAIRQRGGIGLVLIESRWEKQLTDYARVHADKIGNNDLYSLFVVEVK